MIQSPVYIADSLLPRYPNLQSELAAALTIINRALCVLPGTRDIWVRDYMPVSTPSGQLVQFSYMPDYLRGPHWQHLVTDATAVCRHLSLAPQMSALILDGGNVVRSRNCVLMTDKVLRENPRVPSDQLRRELENLLETDRLIFLPTNKHDFTGHADGMVYLLDDHTVLVNDYQRENAFWQRLRTALRIAQLDYVPLTYNPYYNRDTTDAAGIYINFLRINSHLLLPVYGQSEDDSVLRILGAVFPRHTIVPIYCREVAREGGLLHCVTWTKQHE